MSTKNVIGVCVTKVQEEMCKAFLGSLFKAAQNADFRVCVFQSVYEFDKKDEAGAAFIYKSIPYDRLAAIVLMSDAIFDNSIVENIITEANAHNIPVIMAKNKDPRCYSLIGKYERVYRDMIRKILIERDVHDVFFLAGRRHHDEDSKARIAIFKSVTDELGIPFDDKKIDYGYYEEKPARKVMDKLLSNSKVPPRAIFCANDVMSLAAIEILTKYGYSVPIDTIVVGFDGLESSVFSKPRLTTCAENMDTVAKMVINAINEAMSGDIPPCEYSYEYEAVLSESAGYYGRDLEATRQGNEIFRRFRLDKSDEADNNSWIDSILEQQTLDGFRKSLPAMLGKERTFIIREDPFWEMQDERARCKMPKSVLLYGTGSGGEHFEKKCHFDDAMEYLIDNIPDNRIGYASAISMHDMVYGIGFNTTSDPTNAAGRMNRFAITLNRAFSLAVNGEKQLYLAEQINRNRYTDNVTGMFNSDGAAHWYADFIKSDRAAKKYISIGAYALVNYQQLVAEYGLEFAEDCLQFVANTLVLVNPDKEITARISNDTFIVITAFDIGATNAEQIDQVINDCYQIIDVKKKKSDERWDKMEVSCGYTISENGVYEDLSSYINYSIATMFKNRNALLRDLPSDVEIQDGNAIMNYKIKLISLVKDNQFIYNFQPIINAHTGEIYGYEGLMRTTEFIGMNPLEVLKAANMFGKNQDIEWATFNNIFDRIKSEPELFENKKVFINTIPETFLTEDQCHNMSVMYGSYLDKAVIEITESSTISAQELDNIKTFYGEAGGIRIPIAIDDYGTGHSNIVNLLEYRPEVVKIDRYLISNINEDRNKQMFVKNLIEFADENNIMVLAEGVETREELKTVIEFGVDLIQGYYTARPSYEIMQKLPENIYNEIVEFNRIH